MLNIKSILKAILKDLQENPDNIKILDDQHIIDKLSGVEYHLYDDYFHMTRNGKSVTESHFTKDRNNEKGERSIIKEIKDLITDPEKTKDKQDNYEMYLMEGRELFSSWYENPEPTKDEVEATPEAESEEYVR